MFIHYCLKVWKYLDSISSQEYQNIWRTVAIMIWNCFEISHITARNLIKTFEVSINKRLEFDEVSNSCARMWPKYLDESVEPFDNLKLLQGIAFKTNAVMSVLKQFELFFNKHMHTDFEFWVFCVALKCLILQKHIQLESFD